MNDVIDTKILSILQSDARLSNAQIARNIGLAPSGVLERIRKLEKRGIVTGYHASLDAAKVARGTPRRPIVWPRFRKWKRFITSPVRIVSCSNSAMVTTKL